MTSRRTVFRADDARGSVHITTDAFQVSEKDDLERYGVKSLAYHEAGHAIAALDRGGRVTRIQLWPEGGAYRGRTWITWPDEAPVWFHAAAVSSLAATPAEERWLAEQPRLSSTRRLEHSTSDAADALDMLARIPTANRPSFLTVTRSADRLIARRWSRVQQLAEQLWLERHLTNVRM